MNRRIILNKHINIVSYSCALFALAPLGLGILCSIILASINTCLLSSSAYCRDRRVLQTVLHKRDTVPPLVECMVSWGKKDKQLTDYIIPVSNFINVIMEATLMGDRIIEADLKIRISRMSFFRDDIESET